MFDRRDFIKTTAAAGAIAATPGLAAAAAVKPSAISLVLYDPRFSDSRAFAQALMARGARGFSTEVDIGRLWNGPLGEAFAQAPGALAGMTPHTDLFVSTVFARELARARVAFEALHDSRGAQVLSHRLEVGSQQRGLAGELTAAGGAWPTRLADCLALSGEWSKPQARETAITNTVAEDHPGALFSWVIARDAT
jgi:hypothetical protein